MKNGESKIVGVTVKVPAEKIEAIKREALRLSRKRPLNLDDVIGKLLGHKKEIGNFGVLHLSIFGSTARGDSTMLSDIDLLAEFQSGRPEGIFELIDLKRMLEGLLERPVDLVTPATIKPRLKDRIMKEAINVF